MRFVNAERILPQRIARGFVRPGPRSAAQRVIFAVAAAPVKLPRIVQAQEHRRIPVNIRQPILANIAHGQRQKARRADVAGVRYK